MIRIADGGDELVIAVRSAAILWWTRSFASDAPWERTGDGSDRQLFLHLD
jgi:hypothetical protein